MYKYKLGNATALDSRIPPHAVLLHVNNTPVKVKIIFAINFKKDVHLRNDARTIIGERSAHAQWRTATYIHIYKYITSKRYSVGARLSGRTTDGLYVLLCRYIRSQVTHRYISRSAASYEEPISSYSLELK